MEKSFLILLFPQKEFLQSSVNGFPELNTNINQIWQNGMAFPSRKLIQYQFTEG